MKITEAQFIAAEVIASDVFDKQLTAREGAELLAQRHGLNLSSAYDFINDYKYMMQGRLFQRAMSAPAMDHFLSRIRDGRGARQHALAVIAVDLHINYYEQLRGTNLNKMRAIVDAHRKHAAALQLEDHVGSFNQAVADSLNDNGGDRQARLKTAPKMPIKISVVTFSYVRNPDVVAEVLIRANGKCEQCFQDAPFRRKKDGEPYLEVHHVRQLALGGEDTVNNALALCPNCHRRSHYGL